MKIIFFVNIQFDIAPNKTPGIEILRYFQLKNDVYLITGYKKNRLRITEFKNDIIFIDGSKIAYITKVVQGYCNEKCNQIKLRTLY